MASPPPAVPRWEWRTFGAEFPECERLITDTAREPVTSSDTYVLCGTSDVNVKIRRGLLDVKHLLRADRGLEQWYPVLKVSFPIGAAVVSSIFHGWAIPPPPLTRPLYTQDQFLADVVAAAPELRVVEVAKQRRSASIDGCTVEVATLDVAGQTVRTAAIEAADTERVLRLMDTLGLSGHENVNYIRALRRMLDAHPARAHPGAREGALS